MILEKDKLKEKLEQLVDIRKEMIELTNKINKLQPEAVVEDYVYSSMKYFPYTKHKVVLSAENKRLVKILEKYKNNLNKTTCELLKIEAECEQFISEMPDSRLRRIFRYRYFEQYSWRKIAYAIGGRATPDSVRMEHNRFFEEN